MSDVTTVYHEIDTPLSIPQRVDRILDLCERGQVSEAQRLLVESNDPSMLMARGIVYHGIARSGGEISHEEAKDLLTKAESLGANKYLCRVYIGLCLWRQNQIPEAIIYFGSALDSEDDHVRFLARLGVLQIQCERKCWQEARRTLAEMEAYVDGENEASKGKFFHHRAWVYALCDEKNPGEYRDKFLTDYEAARFFYEQCGNIRCEAAVLNNLAYRMKDFDCPRAHTTVDQAIAIYRRLGDRSGLASALDTKANIYLAEAKLKPALKTVEESIRFLNSLDDKAWLGTSLITRGRIYARQGHHGLALKDFNGAVEQNIEAIPAIIQECVDVLPLVELVNLYQRLPVTLETSIALLLVQRAMNATSSVESIEKEREMSRIKDALDKAKGKVTVAARSLGLSHSTLTYLINNKYPELKSFRRPSWKRKNKS